MTEEKVYAEMAGNKKLLESVIDKEVRHFAYPFGEENTACLREAIIAERVGFFTAVTTRKGNIFKEHSISPYLLPRHTVLNHDRGPQIAAKIAGVEKLLRN
jgi:peptidoglycan/xylan/chitin deacetylase (PgdA/CDA1 family)